MIHEASMEEGILDLGAREGDLVSIIDCLDEACQARVHKVVDIRVGEGQGRD